MQSGLCSVEFFSLPYSLLSFHAPFCLTFLHSSPHVSCNKGIMRWAAEEMTGIQTMQVFHFLCSWSFNSSLNRCLCYYQNPHFKESRYYPLFQFYSSNIFSRILFCNVIKSLYDKDQIKRNIFTYIQ